PAAEQYVGEPVIPRLDDVPVEAELDVLERLKPGEKGVTHIVEPAPYSPVAPQPRDVVPLDLGVVEPGKRIPVLGSLSLEHGAHDIDVLRHATQYLARTGAQAGTRGRTSRAGRPATWSRYQRRPCRRW